MRRLLAILSLVSVLAVAVGALYVQGVVGLEKEEQRLIEDARDDRLNVLESIRREVGEELRALIKRETSRPYYQYQHLYVPPEVVSNQVALVPSPLADAPNEPLVGVYFQYRGGEFKAPAVYELTKEQLRLQETQALQKTVQDGYALLAKEQLEELEPMVGRCMAVLEEGETSVPQEDVLDNLITHSNGNLDETLGLLAGAYNDLRDNGVGSSSLDQSKLNSAWQGYQGRGGKRPDNYSQQKVRPRKGVKVRVFPFRTLRVLRPDGWPKPLLVVRRVEVGEEAWLQGFSLDVAKLRDVLLVGAIQRRASPTPRQKRLGALSRASSSLFREGDQEGDGNLDSVPGVEAPVSAVPTAQAAGQRGLTLPLLPPFEEVSLVHSAEGAPQGALEEGRWLLNGALLLVGLVILVGSGILFAAARSERRMAQQRADFVAALTHELKAPLTGVRALTELMHEGLVTDPEKKQEYYASMLTECDRLARLVQNVLSVAKLERGQLPVLVETVDPLPVLRAVADRFKARFETAGFAFDVVLPAALPQVLADREGIDHVVANLLDNAAKYGRGQDQVVILEAVAEDRVLRVAVADKGPGVAAGERESVFGQFARSKDVPREVGGAGLGLSIARAQARAVGGELKVGENPGGGARFEFTLPLASPSL